MSNVRFCGYALVLMAVSTAANAASFDCQTAKHPNEKLICESAELSSLDDQMVATYNQVLSLLYGVDSRVLKQHQQQWLKERMHCEGDFLCTKNAYERRIQILKAQAESSNVFKIDRNKLSITVPLSDDEGSLQAIFDFGGRGFGKNFTSDDGTIIAVNNHPATKAGYVHLWLRFENGDLMFINNVNGRVTRMLTGQAAEWAKSFLLAQGISDRTVFLSAIEGTSPTIAREYNFAIRIGEKGELILASGVRLRLPRKD